MFIFDQEFDIGMIRFIRNSVKNFIKANKDGSINQLPIKDAPIVEDNANAQNLDDYINNIIMKDNEDA